MIIDFHTHIFPPSFREKQEYAERDATFRALYSSPKARMATAEELVEAMDQANVDMAVVMGVGWTDRQVAKEANDYIIESAGLYPSRIVGLCSVNPAWGADAITEIERCAEKGVKGIGELHPDSQGFDIGDVRVMSAMMETARGLGLFVLTHSSEPVGHHYPGKGKTTPEKLHAFVRNFPENEIVCAHWGGGLPFYTLMPEVARDLENVYFDTAASPLLYTQGIFSTVHSLTVPDRVLFGSDFPLIKPTTLLKQLEAAGLPGDTPAKILGENARRLLEK